MPAGPRKASPLHAFGAPRQIRHPFEGKTDTRRRRKLKDVARALPRVPGVYFFYGINDRLLYVGKAKCLRERVRSYFAETSQRRPPKLRRLLAEIQRLDWEECGSELEALLLERRLIADHLPILNRQHKRFEVYPYLLLSDEAFPRLTITRAEPLQDADAATDEDDEDGESIPIRTPRAPRDGAHFLPFVPRSSTLPLETPPHAGSLPGLYLGPFTSPRTAAWTFEAVRTLFPIRSCEGELIVDANGRSCFYHEIGRCAGPCIGASSAEQYKRICADLLELLRTGQAPQVEALRARMHALAEEWKFEDAAALKAQLDAIEAVATRLRRLERMRRENNVVIVQCARPIPEEEVGKSDAAQVLTEPRDTPEMLTCREPEQENATSEVGQSLSSQNASAAVLTEGITAGACCVFLVQGGMVRRHLTIRDWTHGDAVLRKALRDVYDAPPPAADFTAKAELDEMMILDRWLKVHREEPFCLWMNERSTRQWTSNTIRRVRSCLQKL